MDRNTQPPEDFEALLRLLALKRHERPPPGFFNDFSDRVMSRIAQEEEMRARSWWDRLSPLTRFGGMLFPANAITVCGLAVVGASLYLVLHDHGPRGGTQGTAAIPGAVLPVQPAGWSPPPFNPPAAPSPVSPRPPLEAYAVLNLAPAPVEPDTNEVPRNLFTLPRMRTVQGVQVETTRLLLVPR